MRFTRGQAAVEYVSLVGLLLLVVGAGTVTVAAPGLANGVVDGIRRGLCLVTGGGCTTLDGRPCVIASTARDETVTVHASFVRLSDHAGLLRQELSDGTVRVSLVDDVGAGLQLGAGAEGHVDVGGTRLGTGEVAAVAAMGVLGARRTWLVPDRKAADRLVERLRGPTGIGLVDHPVEAVAGLLGLADGPPPADTVTRTAGVRGIAEAHLDVALAAADLDGIGTLSAGVTEDRRTGERTVLLRADGNVTGNLARGILRGRLRAVDSASAAIVFGRDGRPRELVVSGVGELDRGLGGTLGLGRVAVQRVSGGRAEVDAHLDITDAANLAAVRRVTAGLAVDPPTTPGAWARAAPALAALAGLIDADGRIDVRTYASTGTSAGAGADAGVGGRYGAEGSVSEDDLHLLQAWSRPPGGLWDTRLDCTRAASAAR